MSNIQIWKNSTRKSGYNTYRGWTQIDCQGRHWNTDQKEDGTLDDRRRDGGTNCILRIKEKETRLTLQEHDDDDDDDEIDQENATLWNTDLITYVNGSGVSSKFYMFHVELAGIDQLVQRLAAGWTVRGSNPGEGEIFLTSPDRPWGPPSLVYNGYRVFLGGKTARAWRWPPTPSSAEVEGRVEQYFCASSGPSWPLIGWPLPLHFYCTLQYAIDFFPKVACCAIYSPTDGLRQRFSDCGPRVLPLWSF